jgi:copper chaperone CopZ
MTCGGCQAKVENLLSNVKGVKNIVIDLKKGQVAIGMDRQIAITEFTKALKEYPKYQISESNHYFHRDGGSYQNGTNSWLKTYKPILLIFAFIIGTTVLTEVVTETFNWHKWMSYFMAGFFLVFSFFKLLDLKGFAESYRMYDVIAKKWNGWGYFYAFIELALGVAFLTMFNPIITNGATFVVMSVSIVGVLQSVLRKRKIKCACLGAVFNLPMSTVTIIEDALMIGMSAIMIVTLL